MHRTHEKSLSWYDNRQKTHKYEILSCWKRCVVSRYNSLEFRARKDSYTLHESPNKNQNWSCSIFVHCFTSSKIRESFTFTGNKLGPESYIEYFININAPIYLFSYSILILCYFIALNLAWKIDWIDALQKNSSDTFPIPFQSWSEIEDIERSKGKQWDRR